MIRNIEYTCCLKSFRTFKIINRKGHIEKGGNGNFIQIVITVIDLEIFALEKFCMNY